MFGAIVLFALCNSADSTLKNIEFEEVNADAAPTTLGARPPEYDFFLPISQRDVAFLPWLLKSIEVHRYTPRHFIVVVPPADVAVVKPILPSSATVVIMRDQIPASGYLSQQVVKLFADQYGSAPFIVVLEADMVFTRNDPACFWHGDKVKSYCIEADPSTNMWAKGTAFSLKLDKPLQSTCVTVTPFAFPRSAFRAYRRFIRRHHNMTTVDFVSTFAAAHNVGWLPTNNMYSEFEQLSGYMWYYRPELVHRVDFGATNVDRLCSAHTGAIVTRVDGLENPKLTTEYFRLAAAALRRAA